VRIAAFLPSSSVDYLRDLLPEASIVEAHSWIDLEHRVADPQMDLALIDPSADGIIKIGAATRVLSRHRDVPFVGYMPLTNQNMKAVVALSRQGLAHALLHPLRDRSAIPLLANEFFTRRLSYELLGFFEARLMTRAPQLSSAIRDLLERPQRYDAVADLAQESSRSTRQLYREFKKAGLGSPRKFVIGSKVLRAYTYLRSGSQIRSTAQRIGSSPRVLCEQTNEIFGCSPSSLGHEQNATEVVVEVIEWIYKPRRQSQGHGEDLRNAKSVSSCDP